MYEGYYEFIKNAFFRCAMGSAGFANPTWEVPSIRFFLVECEEEEQHIKNGIDMQNGSSYIQTYPQFIGQHFIGAQLFHFEEDDTY
eukprot:192119-Amorphochlora_amoeboformis.AAC.1